jgi:lipopolysaccharide transport system ATP-binding protein
MTENRNANVIELIDVDKIYRSYPTPRHRLLELMSGGRKSYARETRALDQLSLSLAQGERLGIVGANGSGKSTLLKILAGVLTPSSGSVQVRGRVSALLELGAGFDQELGGTENIRQFCLLHGMDRDEIDAAMADIIRFSELADAIDHPVKTYSSGMAVRLGFACAVHVQPDILIVDEALSVGDAYFQNKCLHKIRAMLDRGMTFLYVAHAPDAIRALCSRGLWLENGKARLSATSGAVGAAYQSHVFKRMVRTGLMQPDDAERQNHPTDGARRSAFSDRVASLRTGSGEIRIEDIVVVNADGVETETLDFDTTATIRIWFRATQALDERANIGLGVTDSRGMEIVHFSSCSKEVFASDAACHAAHMVEFTFQNPLCPGQYGINAGIGILVENPLKNGQKIVERVIDYCAGASCFTVSAPEEKSERNLWGIVHVDYAVALHALE